MLLSPSFVAPTNGNVISSSESQPPNAATPIEVTLLGISIEVSELQFANAHLPIELTLSPITTEVSELQP